MSKRTIEVHYHPAIKEVKFYTTEGRPFESDYLKQWQYDKFVLQEHGDDFFTSISEALDSVKQIHIRFFGTLIDYDDFQTMVNYYNSHSKSCNFSCEQSGILLSMDDMYVEAEKFGENATKKLKGRLSELEIAGGSHPIKEIFKKSLKTYIETIDAKINSLKSTGINICFVGTYSAGKSSLINSILGEKILPEDNESKTAKFYIITHPVARERESIYFELDGIETSVIWNGTSLELDNKTGTHDYRKDIQNCIDKNKNEAKHKQFYELLDMLNGADSCVGIKIKINYPIPMNAETMSFTIYDTPGTGSNTSKHKDVLEEAVEEQSHSIVIFVGGVTKLEGEGNSLLLQILNGDNKNSIDLDRSLYVINRADTTDIEELHKYQTETIKLKDSAEIEAAENPKSVNVKMEIPLKDKKLFFVSATQAYSAKAKQHNLSTEKEERIWKKILDEEVFFEYNKCGNSEAATERMKSEARNAIKTAINEYDKAYINAGLYSLIEAIKEYGEKYAMATKVNALISTVDEILNNLKEAAQTQEDSCRDELDELEKNLNAIQGRITNTIDTEYKNRVPKKKGIVWVLEEKDAKNLVIDKTSIKKYEDAILIRVEEELKQKGRLKKTVSEKFIDSKSKSIELTVNTGLNAHIAEFNSAQKFVIKQQQDEFKNAIINVIMKDGELTQAAKDYLKQGLSAFDISETIDYAADIKKQIRNSVETKSFLWIFKWEEADTHKLLANIENLLDSVYAEKVQNFIDIFCDNAEKMLIEVKRCFENNADNYSTMIQSIKENKAKVLEIASEARLSAGELKVLLDNLNNLVWGKDEH